MSCLSDRVLLLPALLAGLIVAGSLTSCNHSGEAIRETQVKTAFDSCKNALLNNQTDQVMAYIPSNVDEYINHLKSAEKNSPSSAAPNKAATDSPGVDLLLQTALERKVPNDIRAGLTFKMLMQRIAEKRLLSLHEVQQIDLGPVYVHGDRASAEIYYQGTLTALRMPFVQEGKDWKIDVLAILPYAEVLMRLDRAIKGETQGEQVEFLVSRLPSL